MDATIDAAMLRAAAATVRRRWPEQAGVADTLDRDANALDPGGARCLHAGLCDQRDPRCVAYAGQPAPT